MTYLKLTTIGNATAVVMPDDLLARLKVGAGDTLRAEETSNGGLLLTAEAPDHDRQLSVARDLMGRYRNTLHALSK